jgi:hypothetical protein
MRAIVAHHCSVCHQDVLMGAQHSCGGTPTPCRPSCYAAATEVLAAADVAAAQEALADYEQNGGTTFEALKSELGLE